MVETGVASGKPGFLTTTVDAKLLWSIATNEFGHPPDRQTASPCNKFQQLDTFLIVHVLHHLPEPLDLLAVLVVLVGGILQPAARVCHLHVTQLQFQLFLIKAA